MTMSTARPANKTGACSRCMVDLKERIIRFIYLFWVLHPEDTKAGGSACAEGEGGPM